MSAVASTQNTVPWARSPARTWAGSRPSAMHFTTMSRSVRTPCNRSSAPQMGSEPTPRSRMRCAAVATLSSSPMHPATCRLLGREQPLAEPRRGELAVAQLVGHRGFAARHELVGLLLDNPGGLLDRRVFPHLASCLDELFVLLSPSPGPENEPGRQASKEHQFGAHKRPPPPARSMYEVRVLFSPSRPVITIPELAQVMTNGSAGNNSSLSWNSSSREGHTEDRINHGLAAALPIPDSSTLRPCWPGSPPWPAA